jgi:hypothetical protein
VKSNGDKRAIFQKQEIAKQKKSPAASATGVNHHFTKNL